MHVLTNMLPSAEEGDSTRTLGKLTALSTVRVEPAGRWYEAYCIRRHQKQTLSHHSLSSSSSDDNAANLSGGEEEDAKLLMTLDPKEWKQQDHYAVLGLSQLRSAATEDQIKKAYKKKVLRHHPDKRRARGIPVKEGEEDYFTCVTHAYEILGVPNKRRSYDSVDTHFNDSIPSNNAESKQNFYDCFGPVFARNSRWSVRKPVPELADEKVTFDYVDNFYAFWYDFDSWREYSYLDEEEKEKGENRDERRWIEKQNKAARQKRKKEEVVRLRQLVDNAYACDPRIARFKAEEKEKKLAGKRAKQEAARQKAEEEKRIKQEALEEERKKKEKEEEEAKEKAAIVKKEKEAQKKILKKERKTLRTSMKDFNYFAEDDDLKVLHMQEVDKLAELLSVTNLQDLNEALTSGDEDKAKTAFLAQMEELNAQLEQEQQKQLEASQKPSSTAGASSKKSPWFDDEVQHLIKAVNLFPAGTGSRWETVANYLKQHVEGSNRTAKEVLAKAKDLQKMDASLKEEANKKAFNQFSKGSKGSGAVEKVVISERYDSVAEQLVSEQGSNPAPWNPEEQKRLEQSLRTYPASTPQRWDKIAEVIPTRSKKDCMKRYKELVEMVQAKKAATAATLKDKAKK